MNTHDIKKAAADIASDATARIGPPNHPASQDAAGIALLCDLVAHLADRVANLEAELAASRKAQTFMDK